MEGWLMVQQQSISLLLFSLLMLVVPASIRARETGFLNRTITVSRYRH